MTVYSTWEGNQIGTIHIHLRNLAEMMVHILNCHWNIVDTLKLIRFYRTNDYSLFRNTVPKIIIRIGHVKSWNQISVHFTKLRIIHLSLCYLRIKTACPKDICRFWYCYKSIFGISEKILTKLSRQFLLFGWHFTYYSFTHARFTWVQLNSTIEFHITLCYLVHFWTQDG